MGKIEMSYWNANYAIGKRANNRVQFIFPKFLDLLKLKVLCQTSFGIGYHYYRHRSVNKYCVDKIRRFRTIFLRSSQRFFFLMHWKIKFQTEINTMNGQCSSSIYGEEKILLKKRDSSFIWHFISKNKKGASLKHRKTIR